MSTPLVSVIVPIYNVDKYLAKCLDSLINQTLKDIEIICVNDGSTDNSEKIAQEYAQKDNRIRYIYQENQGRSVTRNTGINISRAPYLMFCDSDDWYDETMCEKMYQAIANHDVDFACCGIQMVYDLENPTSEKSDNNYYSLKYEGVIPVNTDMLENLDGSSCNKIMKKAILDQYNIRYPEGLIYEDYCLFFQLLSVSKYIYCLPEYLYYYRRHKDSIMVSTFAGNSRAIDHLKIMPIIHKFLNKNNLWDRWEKPFFEGILTYFHLSYTYLPKDEKCLAFDFAIPFMKQFSQERVDTILSEDKKTCWNSILNKSYASYIKRFKICGLSVFKISQKPNKYQIKVLGLRVFQKKIKKKKIVYSIFYIPVLKRKMKHA